MPNYCSYLMYVKGEKEKVEEFIKVIQADYDYNTIEFGYDRHLFRVFEAECSEVEEIGNDKWAAIINGYCAWSVASCMFEDGYYKDLKERFKANFRGTTLINESEKLNLEIEVFSEECGCCFQEHYRIRYGVLELDECEDWFEYDLDEFEDKEEAEKELGIKITDEEWNEGGYISRGGFGEWNFEI